MKRFRMPIQRWTLIAGALLFLAGCGGPGTVTGKVTLDGKPLASGYVSVHDSTTQPKTGTIDGQGNYIVANVNPGPTQITVMTAPGGRPIVRDTKSAPDPNAVAIPEKYNDPAKSGLALEVKSGKQEFDIQLKGEAK